MTQEQIIATLPLLASLLAVMVIFVGMSLLMLRFISFAQTIVLSFNRMQTSPAAAPATAPTPHAPPAPVPPNLSDLLAKLGQAAAKPAVPPAAVPPAVRPVAPVATGPYAGAPPWFTLGLKDIGFHEVGDNRGIETFIAQAHAGALGDPWCFTGETEVLTSSGFVRFDAITGNEIIYQADGLGRLSLTTGEKIEKNYDGDVFDINHRSIKLTCDIGHRWFGRWHQDAKEEKFQSLEKLTTSGLRIPAVKSSNLDAPYSDEDLTILAAFISDGKYRKARSGNITSIEFEVSRQRKLAALHILQPAHVYQQKRAYGPLTKTPLTVFTFPVPLLFKEVFVEYKRLSREFVNSLSRRQAELFLRSYAKFDGDDGTRLYTSSRHMRDDLIIISLLAGRYPCVYKTASQLSGRPTWLVSFGTSVKTLMPNNLTKRRFVGKLYCVSVPLQRIVVRGENGCPVLTGNCAIWANAKLEQAGTQGTRSASSQSFTSDPNFVKLDIPALGAIAVYWRNSKTSGVGHVGFYVDETATSVRTLGGNEGDMVQIEALPKSSATFGLEGYWWPRSFPMPKAGPVATPASSLAHVVSAAPASSPSPGGALTGRVSVFGGPSDTGMAPDEGLALCEPSEVGKFDGFFLPTQPPGTSGLGRRLNPDSRYIACRWDYKATPRAFLQGITVPVSANGKTIAARPIDWGPNEKTGRIADLSPGLASALGLKTDDTCTIVIPQSAPAVT